MRLASVLGLLVFAASCSGGEDSSGEPLAESSTDAVVAYVEGRLTAGGFERWDGTDEESRRTFTVQGIEGDRAAAFSLDFSVVRSSLEARPVEDPRRARPGAR